MSITDALEILRRRETWLAEKLKLATTERPMHPVRAELSALLIAIAELERAKIKRKEVTLMRQPVTAETDTKP